MTRYPDCSSYEDCLTKAALANGPLTCDTCPDYHPTPQNPDIYTLAGCYALLCKIQYPQETLNKEPGALIQKYVAYLNSRRQSCQRVEEIAHN